MPRLVSANRACQVVTCTLAMAAASMHGAISVTSQVGLLTRFNTLLRSLRTHCQIQSLADLRQEVVWDQWMTYRKKTVGTRLLLDSYASIGTGHLPRYLLHLDLPDRQRMQQYAFPPLPCDFREKCFPARQMKLAQQNKRKSSTDVLVPLYPVLRQIVRFRKQLAERTVLAMREAQRKVESGEVELPYHFQHTDKIPEVNRDARTVTEVSIQGREVTISFILWDKCTWVKHHPDRYCDLVLQNATDGTCAYTKERNCFFVEYIGSANDLLWFGDLVKYRLFRQFDERGLQLEKTHEYWKGYQERWQRAKQYGFPSGCQTERSGLLTSGDSWFIHAMERGNECIFEFESLYRAVLFGAAFAMITLSNGSRMSELLQVSWNKERRIIRTETVVLLGSDGQPQLGEDGTPVTKQVKLHFQHLLPKGAKTEEERQLFPLSKEVLRLLGEIKMLLEETYGEIPLISPSRSNKKREHLKPERYLFQWGSSADGVGAISPADVGILLRFILYGLDLYTAQGQPIQVSVHVIRHVDLDPLLGSRRREI